MEIPVEAPAPAPETPQESHNAGDGVLAEVIAELQPPPEEPEAAVDQADEAEAEQNAEVSANAKPEPEDFSDERPWTPERVKNAAQAAKELTTKAHRMWAEAENRANRVKKKIDEFKRDRDLVMATRDQIAADVRALQTGDPGMVLQALGRLTQRDPTRVYTDLSLSLAGKKLEPDKVEQLQAKLEAFEKQQQEERASQTFNGKVEHAKTLIVQGVRDPQRWPALAQLPVEEAAKAAAQIEEYIASTYKQNGQRIDIDRVLNHDIVAALNEAELYLRNHPELLQPGADKNSEAASSGLDAGPGTRAKANPEVARRTPGRSLTPSLATQSGGQRELSEPERLQELANDPGFWDAVGLPGVAS